MNQTTNDMIYGLSNDERAELAELKEQLFEGKLLVILDESQSQDKFCRYNYLMKKKIELIQASLN